MKRSKYKGKYRKSITKTYQRSQKIEIAIYDICEEMISELFGFNPLLI